MKNIIRHIACAVATSVVVLMSYWALQGNNHSAMRILLWFIAGFQLVIFFLVVDGGAKEDELIELKKRTAPEWFYPEGENESDYCSNNPDEIVEQYFENNPDEPTFVVGISQATSLPDTFAAVRIIGDEDVSELDFELHDTREEAETALAQLKSEDA